jgi:hypothetical protein
MKRKLVRKKDLEKLVLAPEIKQYRDLQVFEFKGKDARGYDFAVQLSPAAALPLMKEPSTVNADRVNVYLGGDPEHISNIDTEIEISLGNENYKIDAAAMTYIPKGTPHHHHILRTPVKNSWVLSLTLPPKYTESGKSKK